MCKENHRESELLAILREIAAQPFRIMGRSLHALVSGPVFNTANDLAEFGITIKEIPTAGRRSLTVYPLDLLNDPASVRQQVEWVIIAAVEHQSPEPRPSPRPPKGE